MRIIVMRHGAATFFGADRILSQEGINEAHSTALKLKAVNNITRIYTSPKTRAFDTAKIVHEHVGLNVSFQELKDLTPAGSASSVIDFILSSVQHDETVLLVSHIPQVENISYELLHSMSFPPFVTASALIIDTDGIRSKIQSFVSPSSEIIYT